MRKFVYYLATSADGFIARSDGSVDWLESRPAEDYGFAQFAAGIDAVVWGRRTFDQAATLGGVEAFGKEARHYVLTRDPQAASPDPRVEMVREGAAPLARRLRAQPGKDVWVMGGAEVAAAFLDAGELDELYVHMIPVLLGEGIPVFRHARRDVALRLEESRAFPDGVMRLRWSIAR